MATDFFGYNRDVKPNGAIATSEFATINIGGKMGLVQSVSAAYQQTVQARFEAGSPTLYWLTGQPQGTISIARLVGQSGLFSGFAKLQNNCGGVIDGISIALDGTGGCAVNQIRGGASLTFGGGVPESVNVSFSAGMLEVQEGATIRCATMNKA
jgi:hypothetical protein